MLHPERYFSSDPEIRKIGLELYNNVKDFPILSPHGHVEASVFSENKPFPDPANLIIVPDHYVIRMLYSHGIEMEKLGVPTIVGERSQEDSRKIWQIFANHYYLFAGTPTGIWLRDEFEGVFGVDKKLTGESAMEIYDLIQEKLQTPEFLPRALFDQFKIEVL